MKADTRAAIRVLYFVDRRSVLEIAATIGLHPMAVRAALVLPGGDLGGQRPRPAASARLWVPSPTRVSTRGPELDRARPRRVAARTR